jgi:hypothetical protein
MSTQFQELQQQFNKLLNEYKDTYKKYTNAINSKDVNLKQIQNYFFVSETNLNMLSNSSIDACESSCYSNESCSGATFNNTSNNCTLSSGNGNIVYADNSIAIVQQTLYYSNKLKELNVQLSELNKQIMNESKKNYNTINKNQTQSQQQEEIMKNNYNVLLQERLEIEKMIMQFQTIDSAYENNNITVNANYTKYIIFMFIVIILIIFLIKYAFFTSQNGGGKKNNILQSKYVMIPFLCFIIVFFAVIKK